MSIQDIAEVVMELPEKERLELARRIVASIVAEQEHSTEIEKAVKGIEDVVSGRCRDLVRPNSGMLSSDDRLPS